jgi:UDP-4-amino-4,6-dideoxy-N-acetyl-beta-L-altrosamine transaminase
MIPYGRQEITRADIDAVVEVLRSDFITQGPVVSRFEEKVANYCGARYSVTANSATSALHLACLALGVAPGDHVWTSPITFVASANCALYCGASVDFVDIDPATYNISVPKLAEKLATARATGNLPKVVIPVHFSGLPCEMADIWELSREYGFRILEDASHSIGAHYQNEPVGNCRYSDVTVFSFHPVKIITTAEGGIAVTNSSELAERMVLLRSHGVTKDASKMTHSPDGPWYYQQIALGYNFRMTDVQAALGVSQLARLESNVSRRRALAKRYDVLLAGLPVVTPAPESGTRSAVHLYIVRLNSNVISRSHGEVFALLRDAGIGVALHYIPVHTHPYYQSLGFRVGDFPEAERYYAEAITLPLYPTLTEDDQDRVVRALCEAL